MAHSAVVPPPRLFRAGDDGAWRQPNEQPVQPVSYRSILKRLRRSPGYDRSIHEEAAAMRADLAHLVVHFFRRSKILP